MTDIDEELPSAQDERPQNHPDRFDRKPGELGARELVRWAWRQLTSMRTALVLLLLLALAAVPGSVIPQSGVDALKTENWQAAHPHLTPIYQRLGLFSVYDSPWFSAIYILLMVSLVGCILPRMLVYAKALRRQPPAPPRYLTRLPEHATFESADDVDVVLARARSVLRAKRYRLRRAEGPGSGEGAVSAETGRTVSAERGYLREAGNLIFHCAVLVVLVGFAMGGLLGYQGGVIIVKGDTFANTASQYDDFDPGSLFTAKGLDPFQLTVDDFTADWSSGEARDFHMPMTYQDSPTSPQQSYDLRVNHPITIDHTDVFLIGHGYAPVITIKDGQGNVTYNGPTIFLPQDASFLSFGVVKAAFAQPTAIGLEGLFYPTFRLVNGNPTTVFGEDLDPLISMSVYTGDLGLSSGASQSVYQLDKSHATQLMKPDGQPARLDLRPGQTAQLDGGKLGSVTFDGVQPWVRLQISKSPGKKIALGGVIAALVGLLGSLFIRPRRVWVRVRRERGVTMVEVAALDRSSGGDVSRVLEGIVAALNGPPATKENA